jgi:plasmid stabilization system protein ParE
LTGSVRFTAAALADLDEAAEWYNKQRPMLGVQFLEAVRETTNRIATNPKAFRVVAEDVRRANLPRRWPYALWYLIIEPDSVVIAALHHRRDPRLARGRNPGE